MAKKTVTANTAKLVKPKRKPCEPPTESKNKNWRRCKWQFNTICLCYIDNSAYKAGFAMYRDRRHVSDEECKKWFMPVDDSLASGEKHFCRRESAFVEINTASVARRVRKKSGEVIGYEKNLFGEPVTKLGLVIRPEGSEEY